MSLKTGPQPSQGCVFREDKASLGFLACDPLADTLCSVAASTSSAPQQQPGRKEMLVKHMVTMGKDSPTANVHLLRVDLNVKRFSEQESGNSLMDRLTVVLLGR